MKIIPENCKLIDYTSRDPVNGTPPIPVYKIVVTIEYPVNIADNKYDTVELVSIEKYNYSTAEKNQRSISK